MKYGILAMCHSIFELVKRLHNSCTYEIGRWSNKCEFLHKGGERREGIVRCAQLCANAGEDAEPDARGPRGEPSESRGDRANPQTIQVHYIPHFVWLKLMQLQPLYRVFECRKGEGATLCVFLIAVAREITKLNPSLTRKPAAAVIWIGVHHTIQ